MGLFESVGATVLGWMPKLPEWVRQWRLRGTAQVTATVIVKAHRPFLVVANAGPLEAVGVSILIDGLAPERHHVFRHWLHDAEPLRVLRPGESRRYQGVRYDGAPAAYEVRITWSTPRGRRGEWRGTLQR